ncbi:unnamed protein product [Durusdinium trenchii]|uniref:Tetratricopeptide repeat protein 29 n=1 Tax=Durusdinium trenchii TaxID=1381693 RepID=A0ABP0LR62_9DINO
MCLSSETPAFRLQKQSLQPCLQAGNKKAQALALYLAIHVKVYQEDRVAIEKLPTSLKEVAMLYHEAGDFREQEDVMKDILEFHLANSQREAAAATEQEIRDRVRTNKKEEAPCLLRVASVFYAMGAMEGARTLVEEAVASFTSLADQAGQVKALRSLAVLYLAQQKFDDALGALQKALLGSNVEKANICYAQSQIYAAMGGSKGLGSAIESLKEARKFMADAKNQDGELECLQIISELQLSSQKGDLAVATGQEALAVTQASGNKSKEAAALLRLVSASLSSQNEGEALKYAEMAEMKAKEADDIEKEAQATYNVAEILLRRGDKSGAIKRSKEQLARCVERKHSAGQASAMVVLGQALLAENQASAEGMRYLQAALGIYKDSDDFVGSYSAHFALANGYFSRGDLEDGLSHAREVLSCCRRSGDKVNEELVKANIERARQMTAELRMTTPKRPSIENSGILLSPAGPQACHLRHSRVPGSLLDIVASGRNYWGTPRMVVDAAAEADERPPAHCVVFGTALSDNSATQMCLELMDLIGAMAKGDIPKVPVVVQTRGVFGRLCGDMTYGSMTSVAAVTLWGLIRTARLEMPKVPILTLDFQPTMTVAQITRQLKPPMGVAETAYYNKSRWEPQLAAVPSLLRRDLKRDSLSGGGAIPPGEERKAKAESATATKFSRKAFTWTGPSNKMDYCWYRQEWKNVGPAEGEIIARDPLIPVRSLRQY